MMTFDSMCCWINDKSNSWARDLGQLNPFLSVCFRQIREFRESTSLHWLFFKCLQLNIINISKMHILWWQLLQSYFRMAYSATLHNSSVLNSETGMLGELHVQSEIGCSLGREILMWSLKGPSLTTNSLHRPHIQCLLICTSFKTVLKLEGSIALSARKKLLEDHIFCLDKRENDMVSLPHKPLMHLGWILRGFTRRKTSFWVSGGSKIGWTLYTDRFLKWQWGWSCWEWGE